MTDNLPENDIFDKPIRDAFANFPIYSVQEEFPDGRTVLYTMGVNDIESIELEPDAPKNDRYTMNIYKKNGKVSYVTKRTKEAILIEYEILKSLRVLYFDYLKQIKAPF